MAIDEETRKIILFYLAQWKTTRMSKDRLLELKEELMKPKDSKPVSLNVLKRWVKRVVKETSQAEKIKVAEYEATIGAPIAAPVTDRAFRQSVAFDIAATRKAIDKMLVTVSEIKKNTASKGKTFSKSVSPDIAASRRGLEKLAAKLTEIEKLLTK